METRDFLVGSRKSLWVQALLASTILAGSPALLAADADSGPGGGLDEVIVTAQKRRENLQDIPAAVEALGQQKLEDLNVKSMDDYIGMLPSVTAGNASGVPGRSVVFMRGLSTGLSGPQLLPNNQSPTVATYIDEIPTTTLGGDTIDVHIYDVSRVEALAGPQGTLYGSSAEAGLLKVVTNPPDPTKFSAGYDLDGNLGKGGGLSNTVEGFVNIPLAQNIAIRLVGYHDYQAGYIDNIFRTITYPSTGFTVNDASQVKKNFNPAETDGGRLGLKVDLNEDWTALLQVFGQEQWTAGFFGYESQLGINQEGDHESAKSKDSYWAPALTISGKVGDFDVTWAGSYIRHNIYQLLDYTDYSQFYDIHDGFAAGYAYGPGGKAIDVGQQNKFVRHERKETQELRVASPGDLPIRAAGGLFWENQLNTLYYDQFIPGGIDPSLTVPGDPNSVWQYRALVSQVDMAAYGNLAYDVLPNLTLEGGFRVYHYNIKNDLFSGTSINYTWAGGAGVGRCFPGSAGVLGSPCTDDNGHIVQTGAIYRGSITYKITDKLLVYFTTSDGYRPGGTNENPKNPPYTAESLVNYEVGWKTSWLDNRIRWNGDLFYDPYSNFQFSFEGANGVPDTANAGQALSEGIETDLEMKATSNLTVSAAVSVIDAHLTAPYCGPDSSGNLQTTCASPQAATGTQLPDSPYVKGNLTLRYAFEVGKDADAYVQSSTRFQGGSWNYLQTELGGIDPRNITGRNPSFYQEDIASGVTWGNTNMEFYIKNAFNENGQLSRFTKCPATTCTDATYVVNIRPLTVGLRFGQRF